MYHNNGFAYAFQNPAQPANLPINLPPPSFHVNPNADAEYYRQRGNSDAGRSRSGSVVSGSHRFS